MTNERQSRAALVLAVLATTFIVWVLTSVGVSAYQSFLHRYGAHGHFNLALWKGRSALLSLALPFALSAVIYGALLFFLRMADRRGARLIGGGAALVSIAALVCRFGYILNRYTFRGFWKELRNSQALPPMGETIPVAAGNFFLIAGSLLAGWLLWRITLVLLDEGKIYAYQTRARRIAVGTALFPLLIWGASSFAGNAREGAPNVLIIALDTVRLDHLTLAGYPRETTPRISHAATEGAFFANAISQAPWTLSSFGSLLTGLYPSTHGAYIGTEVRLLSRDHVPYISRKTTTIAEIFHNAGYRTVCEGTNAYIRCGLEQGYDYSSIDRRPAGEVVDRFLQQIDLASDKPFFGFVHFNDAHIPNAPPSPFDEIFPASDGRPHSDPEKWEMLFAEGNDVESDSFRVFREHRLCVYDACIRYIDHNVGRLLDRISEAGALDNTLIAIVTDHGEEFWDHVEVEMENYQDPRGLYGVGHGHTLFGEQLKQLFVLRGPGIPAGTIIPGTVRGVDLTPTLLHLAGISIPSAMEGSSLVPFLRGEEKGDRPALSEAIIFGSDRKAIVRDGFKYIYSPNEPHRLFNIRTDPGETINVISSENERAAELYAELELWLSIERKGPSIQSSVDDQTIDDLKALGYVD